MNFIDILCLIISIFAIQALEKNQSKNKKCLFDNPLNRTKCGGEKISFKDCESRSCCYDDSSEPSCFYENIEFAEIPIRSTIPMMRSNSAKCDFSLPLTNRVKCGKKGITKNECENKDCCYDNSYTNAHQCFKFSDIPTICDYCDKEIRSKNMNCYFAHPHARRVDCGWPHITQEECEDRNCCIDGNYISLTCFYTNIESQFEDFFISNTSISEENNKYNKDILENTNNRRFIYYSDEEYPDTYEIQMNKLSNIKLIFKNNEKLENILKIDKNPVVLAMKLLELDIAKNLVNNNIAVNVFDKFNLSPLHYASYFGYENIVLLLLEKNVNVNVIDFKEMTPLHFASQNGNVEIAKLLIKNGAKVNLFNENKWTPLHLATSNGQIQMVKYLISEKANLKTLDKNQWTLLHEASYNGHEEIIRILIENDLNIDAIDKNKKSPLDRATAQERIKIVKMLLQNGANLNKHNRLDGIPFELALKFGDIELIKILISKKINLNSVFDGSNKPKLIPLSEAINYDQTEAAKYLINNGADVFAVNDDFSSPLHAAAIKGNSEIAQLLIEKGIKIDVLDKSQTSPLFHASANGHLEIVKLLLGKGANVNAEETTKQYVPLHVAIKGGYIDVIKALLEYGANIHVKDSSFWSSLHKAALRQNIEIVQLLISQGADINARGEDGSTPLMIAINEKNLQIVNYLLHHKAKVEIPNSKAYTPLHKAAERGNFEIVKSLLNANASLNKSDNNKDFPLHIAAMYGHLEIARLLLDNGAYLDELNSNLHTPLFLSIRNRHPEVSKFLLEKNPDVNIKDRVHLHTPLQQASLQGFPEIVKILLDKGANVSSTDVNQWTPLHEAACEGFLEIVNLLLAYNSSFNGLARRNRTPLWLAAHEGRENVVSELLKLNGILINTKETQSNRTPFLEALSKGFYQIAKMLLEKGANINDVDNEHTNSLHYASFWGFSDIVQILLESGMKVDSLNNMYRTPLFIASEKGHYKSVEYLLKYLANVDFVEPRNQLTPLLVAVRENHIEVVRKLLEYKANVNAVDISKWSPLHFSLRINNINMTDLLLNKGANVNGVDKEKWTPLHLAADKGDADSVELLLKHNASSVAKQNKNQTAYDLAMEKNYLSVVNILKPPLLPNLRSIKNESKFNESNQSKNDTIIGIAVSTSIVIVILFVMIILIIKYKRKSIRLKRFLNSDEIKEFIEGGKTYSKIAIDGTQVFKYNSIYEVKREQIKIGKMIGSGNFGLVFSGIVITNESELEVAIKVVKSGVELNQIKALLDELKIMSTIGKHDNIVSLIAACTENIAKNEIYVAVEYCLKGNLLNILLRMNKNYSSSYIDDDEYIYTVCENNIYVEGISATAKSMKVTSKLIKWALQIACGMAFLCENKIVHCDLATRNVLISSENKAKICDFGMSRQLFEDAIYTKKSKCVLPWKWSALETLELFEFSEKSDVWSYGVTLWEIFSFGSNPYPGTNWNPRFVESLKLGMRMPKPEYSPNNMYDLMQVCWSARPEDRPTFSDIVQRVKNLV